MCIYIYIIIYIHKYYKNHTNITKILYIYIYSFIQQNPRKNWPPKAKHRGPHETGAGEMVAAPSAWR